MGWLQKFGFDKSLYERPNQTWICGRASEGQCCLSGPDARGKCTATTECRPLRRGDRWFCTRPAFLGGPCPEGPLPDGRCCRMIPKCTPVRSLRSWRGLAVLGSVACTLAMLFLTLGSRRGDEMLSPGELSFAHRSMGNDCSQCHGPVESSRPPASWLAVSDSLAAHNNSGLCLKCHAMGDAPRSPHSLPTDRLEPLGRDIVKHNKSVDTPIGLRLASLVSSAPHFGADDLACATCHKEHRGEVANLKKLANNQCQTCHAVQFASFAHGHPQFTNYPFHRRTRIIFDHESHFRQHFKDPLKKGCLTCHQTDLVGGTMLVQSFAVMCSSCHDDQIKGKSAVSPGIPFISLPTMDDHALTGRYAIGQWPDEDNQTLNPFLRVLLSGDPALRQAMTEAGNDFSDLHSASPEKLQAVQTIAWGIKSLIFDLGLRGQDELTRRLSASLGQPLTDFDKEGVVALLGPTTLRSTFQGAFPKLQDEVLAYRKNGKTAATQLQNAETPKSGLAKAVAPDVWVSQGGWFTPDDGTFTLYYRPRGHEDRFLRSWLDLTADAPTAANPSASQAVFKALSAPHAVGQCSKCHSIDQDTVKHINWIPFRPDPLEHDFTHFSHAAHLSLLDPKEGCQSCHALKPPGGASQESYLSSFVSGHGQLQVHSNFQGIDKDHCATCHRPKLVRDDCLLCHNYHVGRFKPVIPRGGIVSASLP